MWDYLCWNRRGDLSSPGWWGVKFSALGGAHGLKQGRAASRTPEFFQEPGTKIREHAYAPTLLCSYAPGLLRSYAPTLLRSWAPALLRSSFLGGGAQRNPGGSASCLEPPVKFFAEPGASEEPQEALPPAWSLPSSFLQRRSL